MACKLQSESIHLHRSRHPRTGGGLAGWCGSQAEGEGRSRQELVGGEKGERGVEVEAGPEEEGEAVEVVKTSEVVEVVPQWLLVAQ